MEKENKPISLVYKKNCISYTIASFDTIEEAENWRKFLAYTMKEYEYNELKIERKLSNKVISILSKMKFVILTIFSVLYIESRHNYD